MSVTRDKDSDHQFDDQTAEEIAKTVRLASKALDHISDSDEEIDALCEEILASEDVKGSKSKT